MSDMIRAGRRADTIIFVCSARDYHAMDWFDEVKRIAADTNVFVATDVAFTPAEPEAVTRRHEVLVLYNIDRLLWKQQSRLSDLWRNAVKALSTPLQVLGLRRLARRHPGAV